MRIATISRFGIIFLVLLAHAALADSAWGQQVNLADVQMPRPINTSEFQRALKQNYPADLWDARAEGLVTLRFRVLENGSVDSVTVTRSTNEALDNAAIASIRILRFRPATARGRPVSIWVEQPILVRPPERRPGPPAELPES